MIMIISKPLFFMNMIYIVHLFIIMQHFIHHNFIADFTLPIQNNWLNKKPEYLWIAPTINKSHIFYNT